MTTASSAYARPELLADTEWLAQHLDDPNIRIIDCDNRDAYRRAHIPGAINMRHAILPDPPMYLKDPDNRTFVLPPDRMKQVMEELGIGDEHLVVTYDSFGSLYATRVWWVLNYYGHTNVKVLNGGWGKWHAEGRPSSRQEPSFPRATFTPSVNPDLVASAEYIMENMKREDLALLDVRSDGEWTGANTRGNKRGGHMPGAVHLEWLNYVTNDDIQQFKPAEELRQMFTTCGITPEKEVVTY